MKIKVSLMVFGMLWFISTGVLLAREVPGQKVGQKISKTSQTEAIITMSNISNWQYWMRVDGRSAHTPDDNSGGIYPANTAAVIYQDGFVWGGFVNNDTRNPSAVKLRVGGQTYRTGCLPGHIVTPGTATTAPVLADANAAYIYRIRKDWESLSIGDASLINDAASINEVSVGDVTAEMQQELLDGYAWAWNNWPVSLGAPTEDDGTPGIAGADQVIWFVVNDGNSETLYNSPPIGLELQVTTWAYNQPGAQLGQVIFKKYKLINKSGFQVDSMFVGQWSDPDVGIFTDDLVGCDIDLSLGFAFSGNLTDGDYDAFGIPPAAGGYDFFQGPLLDGVAGQDLNGNGIDDADDFGTFGLERVGPGKINLPMTSFGYFAAGTSIDDPSFDYDGTLEWYNLLNGYLPEVTVQPYTAVFGANAGNPTKFPLAGDAVKRTGDIDGFLIPPGDRRMVLASGPFTMQPGDVQEIVVGVVGGIVAQAGGNNRNAVAQLKLNDGLAQFLFSTNFEGIPTPPAAPDVKTAVTENEVILEWGSNTTRVAQTEADDPQLGFNFEGYNVYQLPSPTATKSQAVKLLTFDVNNTIDQITQISFLPEFGDLVEVPVQAGTNTGIQRFTTITTDVFSGKPLHAGNEYYFAVTAYNAKDLDGDGIVDTDVPESSIESALNVITVVPQGNKPGVRTGDVGDLAVSQAAGVSDGVVKSIVINPAATTGAKYEVYFTEDTGEILWNLRNTATGNTVLSNQPQVADVEETRTQPIVDGLQVRVAGPAPGVKTSDMFETDDMSKWGWDIPAGTRRFTWANADFGFEGFRGAIGWAAPSSVFGAFDQNDVVPASTLKNVLLVLASVPDGSVALNPTFDQSGGDPNVSFGYRFLRGAGAAPALPEFAPYILNTGGGYAYQTFERNVPLAAYDIDDPENPRRLAVAFMENNQPAGLVDGKYFPGDNGTYDNVGGGGPREWLFILDADYSETPNPTFQQELIGNGDMPVMYWLSVNRRGAVPFSPGGTGEDQFAIFPGKINTPNDVFEFTAPAVVKSEDLAKEDVDNINVFPNPYYAQNPSETSRFNRFVTFTNMPETGSITVRIFSLSGVQVRKLTESDKITSDSQFMRWDLRNESGLPVASGIYMVHVEMPDLGATKVLKVFVVQGEEILQYF
ncbi:MAG: T9SS type A sorting domain-containing protein [Calditrichaeota bacterium]|nr:T9SS type A sorting domain-containing protein [Calditrichota bacterium]